MDKFGKKKPARPMVGVRRVVPPASPPADPSRSPARPKSPASTARPRNPAPNLPNARAAGATKPRKPEVPQSPSKVRPARNLAAHLATAQESFERLIKTEGQVPALHAKAIMMGRHIKHAIDSSERRKKEFEAALVNEKIKFSSRQPFGAIFRLLYGGYRQEKTKLSRYNRIAQYVHEQKMDQKQLVEFLNENGGLNKSAIVASRRLRGEADTTVRRGGKAKSATKGAVEVDAEFDPGEFKEKVKWLTDLDMLLQERPGIYSCVYEQDDDGQIICFSVRAEPDYSVLKGYEPFEE